MALSIKGKQVAGVTSIVGAAVAILSLIHLSALARISLEESQSRGEMLAYAMFQRAREVVADQEDPYAALREDAGIRSLLESAIAYSRNVTYAAIVDGEDMAVAHSFPTQEGKPLPLQGDLPALLQRGGLAQLRAMYSDRTFEIRQPLLLGDQEFGSIRIGVSTVLLRNELEQALRPAAATAVVSLVVATLVAMLLAQWLLRPIHVLKAGLSRLGRGETGVTVDLRDNEFSDLGTSFNTISAQLASARLQQGRGATAESVVEHLEDAVAMFNLDGELLFANASMRAFAPALAVGSTFREALAEDHPYRTVLERTLGARRSEPPAAVAVPAPNGREQEGADRLVMTHLIEDVDRRPLGVMLVARNLGYLTRLQSTFNYSRKLAALGRLFAGLAHEVKNPLNAMTIHLELLKQKLRPDAAAQPIAALSGIDRGAAAARRPAAVAASDPGTNVATPSVEKHVSVIEREIRRLDQVVQDFLKFARPEELKLRPVDPDVLIREVVDLTTPEAEKTGVSVRVECEPAVPQVNADAGMLRQALLNLTLNACQAMPDGGVLRVGCGTADDRVVIEVEDTGVGIPPEHLERIFDLYFTTKQRGSGVGLSMVYRIVQLHDGDVEVHSVPEHGTRFRVSLPTAWGGRARTSLAIGA